MGDETRDALVGWLAKRVSPTWTDADVAVAEAVLDRLAAEDSPVLLVARGDVEERVEWGVRYPAGDHDHKGGDSEHVHRWGKRAFSARREAGSYGKAFVSRTVRSWSLPDGTRVEVTGPWSEVGE